MKPIISIIMGSKSDWATMQKTAEILDQFGFAYEKKVVSAHRTPDLMFTYAEKARERGIKIIIAGAGGAAIFLVWSQPNNPACYWCACKITCPQWTGFPLFHCSDAWRCACGNDGDWRSGSYQRSTNCPPYSFYRR